MRLIDADKMTDDLNDFYHGSYSEVQLAPYQVDRWIEKQPTVTPSHAHWCVIDAGSEGDEAFCHYWATLKCSRCGMEREVEDDYVPDYCEGCGSKMDERENKS